MPNQQHDSKNLGVKTQLLLLLLPPPLAALERDKAPLSNLLQAQGLPLPPEHLEGSLSESPVMMFGSLHRSGLTLRPL